MKSTALLVFLLYAYFFSFSQTLNRDATIILNDNSIQHGSLKYGDWETTPDRIQFKTNEDTRFITYTPADIKSFLIGDIKYFSRNLLTDITPVATNDLKRELIFDTITKKIFIKELVSGKVSLYEYINNSGIANYYIEYSKDSFNLLLYKKYIDDNSQIVSIEKYKNQLSYYFADCMEMLPEIEEINYDEKSLINIFRRHNRCNSEKAVPFIKEKLKYTLDIFGGLTYGNIKFSGPRELLFSGSKYKSFASYTFIVSLGLPIAKKFQHRNILVELGIKNINIKGTDSIKGGFNADYLTNINLNFSYFKANLLYRHYLFSKNQISVFADFGLTLGYAFLTKGEVKNITTGLLYKNYNSMNKSDASVVLGAGANMNKIVTAIRYEQGNILTLSSTVSSNVKMLYFLVGYRIF